ncbi:hypothetical protein RB195_014358 [Necator americanus]|uniref:Uncharacterized protein n=1 Tax=Necator americanus TaxID=51031 RepID=A0ABR1E083_NECAM
MAEITLPLLNTNFEKELEDKDPRKAYASPKQCGGRMERCSPVLNTANGMAVVDPHRSPAASLLIGNSSHPDARIGGLDSTVYGDGVAKLHGKEVLRLLLDYFWPKETSSSPCSTSSEEFVGFKLEEVNWPKMFWAEVVKEEMRTFVKDRQLRRDVMFCRTSNSEEWIASVRALTGALSNTIDSNTSKDDPPRENAENKMSTRAEASAAADAPRSRTTTRVYSFKKYNSSGNTQLKMMLLTKTTTKLGCVRCPE